MTLEMLNFLGGALSCAGPLIAFAHWMFVRLFDREMILVERGLRFKPPFIGLLRPEGNLTSRSSREGGR